MLTKEQIKEMSMEKAEKALKRVLKNKDLELSLLENPHLFPLVEDLANELLWIEDHIRYLQQMAGLEKANQARYGTLDNVL